MAPVCNHSLSHGLQPPVPHTEATFFHEPLQSLLPMPLSGLRPDTMTSTGSVASTNTFHFLEFSDLVFCLVTVAPCFRRATLHRSNVGMLAFPVAAATTSRTRLCLKVYQSFCSAFGQADSPPPLVTGFQSHDEDLSQGSYTTSQDFTTCSRTVDISLPAMENASCMTEPPFIESDLLSSLLLLNIYNPPLVFSLNNCFGKRNGLSLNDFLALAAFCLFFGKPSAVCSYVYYYIIINDVV
ncbi:unnamed protein product [Acanthosepion pharaonis]|uniref:Uncharacterized protein n=1 Tax=Acanthosepion pharaonis TaxID=158019 RepID=A0A812BNS0_ACAPH|nr:unnamed protein product [Sepia pharaonis]